MKIKVLREAGYDEALLGISLSFDQKVVKMPAVARSLAHKQGGHNKFLESMQVWVDITAPRYWWQQYDTYRVGTTKQSESTMHTILRSPFTEGMFEGEDTSLAMINMLNAMREAKEFDKLKQHLPESFLQRRIVCTNYKVLQNIEYQRRKHKLTEWQYYLDCILTQTKHAHFIKETKHEERI